MGYWIPSIGRVVHWNPRTGASASVQFLRSRMLLGQRSVLDPLLRELRVHLLEFRSCTGFGGGEKGESFQRLEER